MATLVICEVFYIINQFSKAPVDQVKKIVCDFFSVTDIRTAKEMFRAELVRILRPDLSTAVDLSKQAVSELPRLVTHSKGDNRSWAETVDLFELVAKADELNIIGQLPTFVAATLDKVPTVKPEDMDLCLLAKRLSKLEDVVAGHSRSLLESA